MAYEIPGFSFPLPAGVDFRQSGQFKGVFVNALGKAVAPTAGGPIVGIRQTRGKVDEAVTIVHNGISIIESGAAVTAGAVVQVNAAGQAVPRTGTNVAIGLAMEASPGAGVQIAVLLIPSAAPAA